jgi:hypothetical protein
MGGKPGTKRRFSREIGTAYQQKVAGIRPKIAETHAFLQEMRIKSAAKDR